MRRAEKASSVTGMGVPSKEEDRCVEGSIPCASTDPVGVI